MFCKHGNYAMQQQKLTNLKNGTCSGFSTSFFFFPLFFFFRFLANIICYSLVTVIESFLGLRPKKKRLKKQQALAEMTPPVIVAVVHLANPLPQNHFSVNFLKIAKYFPCVFFRGGVLEDTF